MAGSRTPPDVPEEPFTGKIRVASKIIEDLSKGLYASPASALKELINNSYDADAKNVHVSVQPDADQIIVEDDGVGMTRDEFERNFAWISQSYKREETDTTELGRPKVGKIGIGFVAANVLCSELRVVSSKRGVPEAIDVTIDFDKLTRPAEERSLGTLQSPTPEEEGKGPTAYVGGDYQGVVQEEDEDAHYTVVILSRVKGEARAILAAAGPTHESEQGRSIYGLTFDSIAGIIRNGDLRNWEQLDAYGRSMLDVAMYTPVPYHRFWIDRKMSPVLKKLERQLSGLQFSVTYDGTRLFCPLILDQEGEQEQIIEPFRLRGKHVSADGYFFARHGKMLPVNQNGLVLRVRNVAVGLPDATFMRFPPSIGQTFRTWISAEIYGDDRLEEAMNIDRRSFQDTHPAYREIQGAVHHFLRTKLIPRMRAELYARRAEEKAARKAEAEWRELSDALKRLRRVSARAATILSTAWENADTRSRRRALLRKHSTPTMLTLLSEVVEQEPGLTGKQLLERLADRLAGEV